MSGRGLLRRMNELMEHSDARSTATEQPEFLNGDTGRPSLWLRSQELTGTPVLLLDSDLVIGWRNLAFRQFRETEGLEYQGRPIYALFSSFAERDERERFIQALKDPECGFSWQGRVTGRGKQGRQFIATLDIAPEDFHPDGSPRWYRVSLYDDTENVKKITQDLFDAILKGSLAKDDDTGNHVERVNSYSRSIAARLKGRLNWIDVDDDYIEDIGTLAAFHDVGKLGTPDAILQKPGRLNNEEMAAMREHPIQGALILANHPNPMVRDIARSHHEWWDGTGYPYGLEKTDIPLCARIVAFADVYDALRTRRPYKPPFSEEEAFQEIVSGSGGHFDPDLVEVFVELRGEFDAIFNRLSDL